MALPAELEARVEAFLASDGSGPGAPDPVAVADAIVEWADGRHPDDLDDALDFLREKGAYAVSLEVIEQAWNAELPPDRLGRIAEDWIGTVLHGLGDRAGAEEVIAHITPRALELGPQFAGDLGHGLLGWDLHTAAAPLIRFAAEKMPGDLSYRYNLGVLHKFAGDFEAARDCFDQVLAVRPEDRAALWNLGIACTALADWSGARRAWTGLGFQLPEGPGDFGQPGDPTPVRLEAPPGAPAPAEVVWGRRFCPARVQVLTVPRYADVGYGDLVLVDGVAVGETQLQGQTVSVVRALEVTRRFGGRLFELHGPDAPEHAPATRAFAERLNQQGWPTNDWTGMPGSTGLHVALVVPPDRAPADALAAVREHLGDVPLDLSPLESA